MSDAHAPFGKAPRFVCPRCHGELTASDERYHCTTCRKDFPIVLGIPDFRLAPDPWIGMEEDREKGMRLASESEGASFADTVRLYWGMTPSTPRPLAERFTRHVLDGTTRAAEWLDWFDSAEPTTTAAGPWLELGCGTGDLVAVAASRGIAMTGIDVAFRWLVVARKRPELETLVTHGCRLVCCNAEHLPFADAVYGRVVSIGTLEHCVNARSVLSETARVLRPGGRVRIKTVNRYSPLREPHVDVWGVGFVPRRWADPYVRWRSGQRYLHHRPLSRVELARGLRGAGLRGVTVGAAPLLDSERQRVPASANWLTRVYERMRHMRGARAALGTIAPTLDASAVRS